MMWIMTACMSGQPGIHRSRAGETGSCAPGVNVEAALGNRTVTKRQQCGDRLWCRAVGALMQEWAFLKFDDLSLNGQNMRYYLTGTVRSKRVYLSQPVLRVGYVNLYDAFLSMRR